MKNKIKELIKLIYFKKIIPSVLIPKKFRDILDRSLMFSTYKRKVKYNKRGYYFLDPMPSNSELSDYYKFFYHKKINNNFNSYNSIEERDIKNFQLILNYLKEIKGLNILHFGSGSSGISRIFSLFSNSVINIDFYEKENEMENIITVENLFSNKIKRNMFDLIYSCHSLEHVNDLDLYLSRFYEILKPEGYIFFEVPNSEFKECAIGDGLPEAPHTYYFKKVFFDNLNYKVLLNDVFISSPGLLKNTKSGNPTDNDIICFLGKK